LLLTLSLATTTTDRLVWVLMRIFSCSSDVVDVCVVVVVLTKGADVGKYFDLLSGDLRRDLVRFRDLASVVVVVAGVVVDIVVVVLLLGVNGLARLLDFS
jgi:hypothetical protein